MSELERERHKNAGLERARDSWYHEWYKATERIVDLKAELAHEKESGSIANAQWNLWMAKARDLLRDLEQAEGIIEAKKRTIETLVGELRVARKLHAKKCDQHMDEHTARIEAEATLAEFMAATDNLRAFLKPGDVVTVSTPGKRGSVTFAMGRFTRWAERGTS